MSYEFSFASLARNPTVELPGEVHAARLARRENLPIFSIASCLFDPVQFSEHFEYNIAYIVLGRIHRIQDTRIPKLRIEL